MEKFGKYEILEKIGEGGFGVIYKGYDPLIKRTVAIKTCTADDLEIRNRFFQEAEISGNLHHRNITVVFDFGLEQGIPYLVQEYLTGEDLARKIKRGDEVPYGSAVLWLIQIARGLQHAHRRGVIHRDIKPSNIRVLSDNSVKIMDFGIAKIQSASRALTQTGETIGTAAYLSPEQIRGEPVDHRADIFAFGLLAYELITGNRAFQGEVPSTVLYKVLTSQPQPIQEISPHCPVDLVRIVNRCLDKRPNERFRHCGDLLAELTSLIDTPPEDIQDSSDSNPQIVLANASPLPTSTQSNTLPMAAPPAPPTTTRPRTRPIPIPATTNKDPAGAAGQAAATTHLRRTTAPLRTPLPAPAAHASATLIILVLGALAGGATGLWWYEKTFRKPKRRPPVVVQIPAPTSSVATTTIVTDTGTSDGTDPLPAPSDVPATTSTPQPCTGTVRIARAWSPELTVAIDGDEPRAIGSGQTFQLKPGSHRLVFAVDVDGYQTSKTTTVELKGGDDRRIDVPLSPPARLTVRQKPGSRRGWVTVNGESVGWTPIQNRPIAPGSYAIAIAADPQSGDGSIRETIALRTGHVLVLTFDLTGSTPLQQTQKPYAG